MSVFVYLTEQCNKDIENHGVKEVVNKQIANIEQTQIVNWDRFPANFRKKRIRNLRIIAEEKLVNDNVVLVLYRLLPRDSGEYKQFISNTLKFYENNLKTLCSINELEVFVDEKLKEDVEQIQPLTNEEDSFLSLQIEKEHDLFVFESKNWVNKVTKEGLLKFPDKLQQILLSLETPKGDVVFEENNYRIYFKKFPHTLFLYDIEFCDRNEINNFNIEFLNNFSEEDAKRNALRSYPFLILADENIWIDVEKDENANLALSPEEEDVLISAFEGFGRSDGGFPLFINGRAGSGKSTILQYLYAYYLNHFKQFKEYFSNAPVFLTYSDSLKESARNNISSILKSYYRFANGESFDVSSLVDDGVFTFQEVLLSFLNENQKQRFDRNKYIDFKEFKSRWEKKFGKLSNLPDFFMPEICWHVVRTFIKGYSVDGYLEKNEYSQLPKKEKTVSEKAFQFIYEKVWDSWYKNLKKEEFWDDQDLVREVLNLSERGKNISIFPGVFCDEAQDFTKIELELLFRINYFSKKKINSVFVKKVPVAFAGDPFQTLNPTGFRWESVKASFKEKFQSIVAHSFEKNVDLNYVELSFNYRSQAEIVNFSNAVQLLRSVLFNYKYVKPQKTWELGGAIAPVYKFNILDDKVINILKLQEDMHLIIPDESSNREFEFVSEDEDLQKIVSVDKEHRFIERVSSSMRAKGLEFKRVAVVKFGDYIKNKLNFAKKDFVDYKELSEEEKLSLEYFLNRLYVSVSRAKKKLFIIDTPEGFDALWRFAEKNQLKSLTNLYEGNADWILDDENPNLAIIQHGNVDELEKDQEAPLALAERYKENGLSQKDSYWLKLAFGVYNRLSMQNEAYYCLALAYKFENEWEKASENFFKCNKYSDALEMLWEEGEYNLIKKHLKNFKEKENTFSLLQKIKIELSKFISSGCDLLTFLEQLKKLKSYRDSIMSENRKHWGKALNTLVTKVQVGQVEEKDVKEELVNLINDIYNWSGLGVDTVLAGKLFFKLKLYEDALSYFKKAKYEGEEKRECEIVLLTERFEFNPEYFEATVEEWTLLKTRYLHKKRWEKLIKVLELNYDFETAKKAFYLSKRDNSELTEIFEKNIINQAEITKNYKPLIMFLADNEKYFEAIPYLEKSQNINLYKDFLTSKSIYHHNKEKFIFKGLSKSKFDKFVKNFFNSYFKLVFVKPNWFQEVSSIFEGKSTGDIRELRERAFLQLFEKFDFFSDIKGEIVEDLLNSYVTYLLNSKRWSELNDMLEFYTRKNKKDKSKDLKDTQNKNLEENDLVIELAKNYNFSLVIIIAKQLIKTNFIDDDIKIPFQTELRMALKNVNLNEHFSLEEICQLNEKIMRFNDLIDFYNDLLTKENIEDSLKRKITFRLALAYYRKYLWQKERDKKRNEEGEISKKNISNPNIALTKANNLIKEVCKIDKIEDLGNVEEYLRDWNKICSVKEEKASKKINDDLKRNRDTILSINQDIQIYANRQEKKLSIRGGMFDKRLFTLNLVNKKYTCNGFSIIEKDDAFILKELSLKLKIKEETVIIIVRKDNMAFKILF